MLATVHRDPLASFRGQFDHHSTHPLCFTAPTACALQLVNLSRVKSINLARFSQRYQQASARSQIRTVAMTAQINVSPGPGAIAAAGTGAKLPPVPRVDASFPDPAQPRVPSKGVPPTALANAGSAPAPVFSTEMEQCQAWMVPSAGSSDHALWITGCLWTPAGYQCHSGANATLAPSCSMGDRWNPKCAPANWLYPINAAAGTLMRVHGCVGTADTLNAFQCLPASALTITDEPVVMLHDKQVPCFLNVESSPSPSPMLPSGSSRAAAACPLGSVALWLVVVVLVVACRLL